MTLDFYTRTRKAPVIIGPIDPLLAFLYDKVNTRFGKLRVLLVSGFAIEAAALLCMFNFMSSKGFGWITFTVLYVICVIGYTITNMTAQTIPAIMTNDPKQRPLIGVWTTAFNCLVPMTMMIVLNMVLLPMFGGQYNQAFLSTACWVCIGMGAVGIILVCIGVSAFDKPENFIGVSQKREPLKIRDMVSVLKGNRPIQCYIVAQATDKLATLAAMRFCKLSKTEMVEVQKRIAEKKDAARREVIESNWMFYSRNSISIKFLVGAHFQKRSFLHPSLSKNGLFGISSAEQSVCGCCDHAMLRTSGKNRAFVCRLDL